jgi:hypothetical protein
MTQDPALDPDVAAFIDGVQDQTRREDSRALVALMGAVTNEPARMWNASIVGFGEYHYRYDSGREGDLFKVGFSPRKANLTLYLLSDVAKNGDLLARLGPHKTGKSCLYVKRLADLDKDVLTELIKRSAAHVDQLQADASGG